MNPPDAEPGFTPTGIDNDFAGPADWARLYRLRGIQVVPAFMPGEHVNWKRPLLKSWTEFQEALVPDEVFAPWYGPGGQYVYPAQYGDHYRARLQQPVRDRPRSPQERRRPPQWWTA